MITVPVESESATPPTGTNNISFLPYSMNSLHSPTCNGIRFMEYDTTGTCERCADYASESRYAGTLGSDTVPTIGYKGYANLKTPFQQ